jgi:alpha-L-rhamnosidase
VHLVELVNAADGHLRTGFLGTPFIAQVLDDMGYGDLAYSILFKETYPSWFFSINQGATTMWERWNSYSHKDGFGDVGMNSFNHYAYGAIGEWMIERVAGLALDPEHPGYKHFFVKPIVGGPLTSARVELETAYGRASSGWNLDGDNLMLNVVVPPNTTATIEFPNGKVPETVGAGTYRFELKM